MTTPDPGDQVYLGSTLVNMHWWGVVSDLDTPAMMTASMEAHGTDGAITLDALVGPTGPPGDDAAIVKMQYQSYIDDPGDLPTNLLDNNTDIGKAWWIGQNVYVWSGTDWMIRQMGTVGPVGPVPNVQPSLQLVEDPDPTQIVISGTASNPGWTFQINQEEIRGPQGVTGPLRAASDYDNSVAPGEGEAIVWNGTHYAPSGYDPTAIKAYSVPEAGFSSFTGITTRQQIAAFALPPQNFDWKPLVWGHIRAIGIEADADPLILGCEVRLESAAAGTLIGRGFGNSSTWTTIVPHFSTPTSTSDAITPENTTGVVPAYHSGTEGTVYCSLFNDGLAGAYVFDKKNAQLVIMVIPV